MLRFQRIWCYIVIAVVAVFVTDINILLAQTNDAPEPEETSPSGITNEVDPTKVELQPEDSASSSATGKVDPTTEVELQRFFNELRKEYLDTRSESVAWWLEFIAIVLAFFGVVIVVLGFLGFQEFKRLKAEAKEDVKEIKTHLAEVLKSAAELEKVGSEEENDEISIESDEAIQNMRESLSAEAFTTLFNDEEFEKTLQDFEQIPNLSIVDKAMIDAYKLQKDGKIKEAIQKWRSVANIVSETDKDLAARAWSSVGYLLSEKDLVEKAVSAYDKAIEMKADYADAYCNRGTQKIGLEQYQPAMEDFDRAIKLNLDNTDVYIGRGIARFELGKHDDALIDFEKAISINPDYPNTYAVRGEAKALLNDLTSAKLDFQKALRMAREQGKEELSSTIEERLQELNEVE